MDSPKYDTNEPGFEIGDRVEKVSGYEYPGVVVSVFKTLGGKRRYVVEHIISQGMLHIFSEAQLKPMEQNYYGA